MPCTETSRGGGRRSEPGCPEKRRVTSVRHSCCAVPPHRAVQPWRSLNLYAAEGCERAGARGSWRQRHYNAWWVGWVHPGWGGCTPCWCCASASLGACTAARGTGVGPAGGTAACGGAAGAPAPRGQLLSSNRGELWKTEPDAPPALGACGGLHASDAAGAPSGRRRHMRGTRLGGCGGWGGFTHLRPRSERTCCLYRG